VVVKEEQ